MSKSNTTPDKTGGSKKQPGKEDIQNTIRPHVPSLIAKAIHIANNCKNENVQLGAIKMLLAKVVPDLRAVEVEGDLGVKVHYVVALPEEKKSEDKAG